MPNAMAAIGFDIEVSADKALSDARKFEVQVVGLDKALASLEKLLKSRMIPTVDKGLKKTAKRGKQLKDTNKKEVKKFRWGMENLMQTGRKMDKALGGHLSSMTGKLIAFGSAAAVLGGTVSVLAEMEEAAAGLRRELPVGTKHLGEYLDVAYTAMQKGFGREAAYGLATYMAKAKVARGEMDELAEASMNLSVVTGASTADAAELLNRVKTMYGEGSAGVAGLTSMFVKLDKGLYASTEQMADFLKGMERQFPDAIQKKSLPALAALSGAFVDIWGTADEAAQQIKQIVDVSNQEGGRLRGILQSQMPEVDWQTVFAEKDIKTVALGLQKWSRSITDEQIKNQAQFQMAYGDTFDLMMKFRDLRDLGPVFEMAEEGLGDAAYGAQAAKEAWDRWDKVLNKTKHIIRGLLRGAIEPLVRYVDEWMTKHGVTVKNAAEKSVAWVKANKPLIVTLAKVAATVFVVGKAIKYAAAMSKVLNLAILGTPVGWVIALAGAIAMVAMNWKTVDAWMTKHFGDTWEMVKSFGRWIGDAYKKIFETISAKLKESRWNILRYLNPLGGLIAMWDTFGDKIKEAVVGGVQRALNKIKGIWNDFLVWMGLKEEEVAAAAPRGMINLRDIPKAQEGGYVKQAPPGGTPVLAHEGEVITPLPPALTDGSDKIVLAIRWLGEYLVDNLDREPIAQPTGPRAAPPALDRRTTDLLEFGR